MDRELFRDQMDYLADGGSVIDLDSAVDLLSDPDGAHGSKVLTFDDGTADFVDEVLPVLVDNQLPATVYVATAHIDHQREFPGGAKPLTWDGLRECVSTGLVTVGSHTHTHALLDRIDQPSAELELDTSNSRIREEIGIAPLHFAYPKALAANAESEEAVRARFHSAALAGTRANQPGRTDPWRLQRSPIQNVDMWDGFIRKVEGGMRAEDGLRRVLNTVRYRGLAA
jgi:peptidoglycan/xylan/chitin deacetylase (PgdA/CDA1 family)